MAARCIACVAKHRIRETDVRKKRISSIQPTPGMPLCLVHPELNQ
jgi:hypothetical protein